MKFSQMATVVMGMLALSGCAGFFNEPTCCDGGYEYRHRNVIETKGADDRNARIAALERELLQRDARIADLALEKQRLGGELAAERSTNAAMGGAMGGMSARGLDLEQQLAQRDKEIARLKALLASSEASLAKTEQDLMTLLKPEIDRDEIRVRLKGDTLTITLASGLLFDSGQDQLKPAGTDVMKRVGSVLEKVSDKKFEVTGHTDNVPIKGNLKKKFPTNMELSKARADFALRELGVSGTAIGHGETKPVDSNDTPAGRTRNRRVEVVVSPK